MGLKLNKTQYHNVYSHVNSKNQTVYRFVINRYKRGKSRTTNSRDYDDIRECAIAVDKWRINNGEEPINILIKKDDTDKTID